MLLIVPGESPSVLPLSKVPEATVTLMSPLFVIIAVFVNCPFAPTSILEPVLIISPSLFTVPSTLRLPSLTRVEPEKMVNTSPDIMNMVAVSALVIKPGVAPPLSMFAFWIRPPALLSILESDKFVIVPSSMVPLLTISPVTSSFVMKPSVPPVS